MGNLKLACLIPGSGTGAGTGAGNAWTAGEEDPRAKLMTKVDSSMLMIVMR